jgi:hypothetical protein
MQIEGPREGVEELVRAATGGVGEDSDGMPKGLLSLMAPIDSEKTVISQREAWGTKWDITDAEVLEEDDLGEGRVSVDLVFDSAWSPPIEAVETFLGENEDYAVRMQYFEPGVAFVGEFTPERGEQTYQYEQATADTVRNHVPEHLVEQFDLEGVLSEIEDW